MDQIKLIEELQNELKVNEIKAEHYNLGLIRFMCCT